MTADALKALINTGRVIAIHFDNEHIWKYDTEEDGKLSVNDIEVVGGLDMIKKKILTHSKRSIGISHCDVPIWIYKPVEDIQGVYLLDDAKDFGTIDTSRVVYTA